MEKTSEKYIRQKAQKIVSALYLITDLIPDSDPIKWSIREEAINFVSTVLMQEDRAMSLSSIKMISLLHISLFSSLLSKMNVDIVIHEIESLSEFIHNGGSFGAVPEGYILSDSFFSTETSVETSKGQKDSIGHNVESRNKAIVVKDKKNNRKESIVSLLKKDSHLTIKDFVKVIKDCSEKTIQRELIDLVEKGIVKREGERRWSTYSLA